ncbi:MAG: class I SAM-dependent methyltransferase [Candidatus Bathyarchaeota archaeon]|nr:MAG: class I SAM-dependent methyltransferase [Candidatus Bathyarchaeota archaeon]
MDSPLNSTIYLAPKNDLDFYKKLALQRGNRALELGVGTGRVAIPLARAGMTILGIDNSHAQSSQSEIDKGNRGRQETYNFEERRHEKLCVESVIPVHLRSSFNI